MATSSPRLRDVRDNFRGARKALHDDFTNLKRRVSSNIGAKATHTSGHSPPGHSPSGLSSSGPGPGKRAKMMVSKTVEKVLRRSSSTSPRSFEPRINTHDLSRLGADYHQSYPLSQLQLQQQQQQDPLDPQSMLDSQIHTGQSGFAAGYYEASDGIWSTHMPLDSAPDPVPSISAMQTHNDPGPCINTNMAVYPSEYWQERTATSRARLLGSPSITPPPHHAVVEGPIHDLNVLDRSDTLRGTHQDRYTRTISTVNDLSTAIASSGSPTSGQEALLPTSPETASLVSGRREPAPLPCRTGSDPSTADGKKPCPWPGCAGTRETNLFESNRLKEHLRRKHLEPYVCGTCDMRKGDKHQIKRHREHKHPREDPKQYKDQTNDGLAAKQLKMLSERAISYERIVRICKATSVEELDDPWGSDVPAYQGLTVRHEADSVPVSPTSGIVSPTSGIVSHATMYGAGPSAPPSITFAGTIPSSYPSGPGLLPAARIPGSCGPRLNTTDPIRDFVTNILVPHVENLNLSSSPSPSRASRDEHLQRVLALIATSAKRELDLQERRRSSGAISSYTEMVASGAQISASAMPGGTPALTNDNTLTARSSSYGSLNPSLFAGTYDKQKQWAPPTSSSQQQQATLLPHVHRPGDAFGGNDGSDQEQWVEDFFMGE